MEIPTSNIAGHMKMISDIVSRDHCSILELGVEHGTGSTQAIRSGLERSIGAEMEKQTHISKRLWISVDIKNQINEWLAPSWPWWYFIEGDSSSNETVGRALELLAKHEIGWFDLIFIDTLHTPEVIAKELEVWSAFADLEKCVWLFHDTWIRGKYNEMTDRIKEFAGPTRLYVDLSKECNGLGAMFPRSNDELRRSLI